MVVWRVPPSITSGDDIYVPLGGTVDFTVTTSGSPAPLPSDPTLPEPAVLHRQRRWHRHHRRHRAGGLGRTPIGRTCTVDQLVGPDATETLYVRRPSSTSVMSTMLLSKGGRQASCLTDNQVFGTYSELCRRLSAVLPWTITTPRTRPRCRGHLAAGTAGVYPITITFVGKVATSPSLFRRTAAALPVIT